MIVYRDMTFCGKWEQCIKGEDCVRAITPEVKAKADQINLPISWTYEFPCFEKRNNE